MPHPALVFVVIAWGLNFSVIKVAYKDLDPAAVGLFRYLWMLPLLALCCRLTGEKLSYPKGMGWRLNFAGFVGSGAYMAVFLEGMRTAPPTLAAIALATAPIMTIFLSVALRQDRFSWRLLVGSLIAFAGVAVAVLDSDSRSQGSLAGTLTVVGSAALWAVSIVLYKPLLKDIAPVRALTLSFPGAMVALLPYGAGKLASTNWSAISLNGWLSLAYLIVIAGVGAFVAYYKGLADVGPARASMTQYFVSPVAALCSAVVLRERVTVNEILGLAIVIGGVAMTSRKPELGEPVVPEVS